MTKHLPHGGCVGELRAQWQEGRAQVTSTCFACGTLLSTGLPHPSEAGTPALHYLWPASLVLAPPEAPGAACPVHQPLPVIGCTTTQRFPGVNSCLPTEACVPEGLGLVSSVSVTAVPTGLTIVSAQ